MQRFLPLLFAAALAAPAQIVSFGIKTGVPATAALPNVYAGTTMLDTGRWTVGPTVEFRLVYGFSAEIDALYRGYSLQSSYGFLAVIPAGPGDGAIYPPTMSSYREDSKAWDIPLLLKRRFGAGPFRPFVDAGYTFTHVSSDITSSFICLGTSQECAASPLSDYFHPTNQSTSSHGYGGPTAGVGLEFKYGKVKIAPELRYSRGLDTRINQATVMVGFTF